MRTAWGRKRVGRWFGGSGLALLLTLTPLAAAAQQAALPDKAKLSPSERAQRDADKVFHWIRLNADKAVARPAPAAAPAPTPAPPPAPTRKQAQVAPAPSPSPIRTTTAAEAPAEAPPAIALVAAPAPQSEASRPAEPATLLAAAPTSLNRAYPMPEPEAQPGPELPLKILSRVEPEIPRQLLTSLRSGSVQVRFMVQPDGSVRQAEAMQSSNKRLAAAAIAAVAQWRFEPIPKARVASVELGFNLE